MSDQETENTQPSKLNLTRFLPLIIFAFSLLIRLWGVNWGLPNDLHHQSYHPDEEVIWKYSQAIEPSKGKFTPGFYSYGTLYLTTLRVASDVTGAYGGIDEKNVWAYVGNCNKAGRIINIFLGALIPVFTFLILRRRVHWLGALAGALALSLSPALTVHSRFQTTDMMSFFFLVVGTWLALKVLDEPSNKFEANPAQVLIAAGLCMGLSAGTKYTGILGVATLCVVWFFARDRVKPLAPVLGVAAAFVGFVVATPGILLESEAFMRDFKFEMTHTSTGHGLIFEGLSPIGTFLTNSLQGFGIVTALLGFVGIVWALKNKAPFLISILAFTVLYVLLVGKAQVQFMRYTFPIYFSIACGLGYLVGRAHEKGGKWMIASAFGIVALGNSLLNACSYSYLMASPDARDETAKLVKHEAQEGKIASVGLVSDPWYWSPALFVDSTISRMPVNGMPGALYSLKEMTETTNPKVIRYLPDNANERSDWDMRLLTESKPDIIVFSNFEVGPVARLSIRTDLQGEAAIRVQQFKDFNTQLLKDYKLEGVENPDADPSVLYRQAYGSVEDMAYVRPMLWVWKRKAP